MAAMIASPSVMICNRIALELSELCNLAPNTRIVKEPEIPIFRTAEERAPAVVLRGDISATNSWATGTEDIFDIRITDTDSATYRIQDLYLHYNCNVC